MASNILTPKRPARVVKAEPGPNVEMTTDWKSRLNEVVEERRLSLRDISSRARDRHGELMAHSTVRTALLEGSNTIRVETLAAICDSIGIDIVSILTGKDFTYLDVPEGAAVRERGRVRVIPVVPMPRAACWDEDVKAMNAAALQVVYLPAYNTEGYQAAIVVDSSMSPRAHKGDIVIYKVGRPRDGGLAVVKPKGAAAVFRNYTKVAGRVELTARNPDFSKQTFAEDAIEFEAEVVSVIENVT